MHKLYTVGKTSQWESSDTPQLSVAGCVGRVFHIVAIFASCVNIWESLLMMDFVKILDYTSDSWLRQDILRLSQVII